ncbi:MAG: acyl-CoA dehydrogenase family protein [Rhodospirillaceae bacterium]|nr:acyl-CoA dehydrogenase family protein [Rhodospirillaceae bacterium]
MTVQPKLEAKTLDLPSAEELLSRARNLAIVLSDRAGQTEAARKLPNETMADLHRLGLLKVFQPRMFGGYEGDWSTHLRIGEALALGCGSTAWIQCVVGLHGWIAARLPLEAQAEIWKETPDILISTAAAGGLSCRLKDADGGYRLTGRWKFTSGIDHADWVILGAMPDDETARKEHNLLELALPKTDYDIIDTWHTTALRGTGSNDVVVKDVFVPKHRTVWRKEMRGGATEGSKGHPGFINQVCFSQYFGSVTLGPTLGTAKGAINAYTELTRKRFGQMRGEAVAAQVPVQTRLSESAAEVRAAQDIFYRICDLLDSAGKAKRSLTKDEWVKMRADGAFMGKLCVSSVERIIKQMGASGLTADNPVQRYHTNITGMAAHISQNWDLNTAPFGAWALGLPTENHEINAIEEATDDLF